MIQLLLAIAFIVVVDVNSASRRGDDDENNDIVDDNGVLGEADADNGGVGIDVSGVGSDEEMRSMLVMEESDVK